VCIFDSFGFFSDGEWCLPYDDRIGSSALGGATGGILLQQARLLVIMLWGQDRQVRMLLQLKSSLMPWI
jgi:hypothetical protein